jgi:4-amino-4-deoxy-L-arabinose transferase-like glycosyltransferase
LKNERRLLLAILALGILLRAALGIIHPYVFDDSHDYVQLAQRWLADGTYGLQTKSGWMTASRMPGYPLFLAGLFALFGNSLRAVVLAQAILSTGTIALAYALARRAGPAAGLLAAALVAVDPLTIGFSAAILSEMPFTLCLLAALWACLRFHDTRHPLWWIVLGLLWGAAVYLRASALWLIIPLAVWTAGPRHLPGALLAVALAFATLLPWWIRNGQGIRLTSMEGISLYESVYAQANGGPKQDTLVLPPEMQPLDEWQRDAAWNRRAWTEIRQHPARILALVPVKIARTWSPWMNAAEASNRWLQAAMMLWHIPLFFLAAVGIFSARLPGRMKALLLLPVLYFTALHSLFLGSVRYRVPLMPLVCVLAAAGAITLFQRLRTQRAPATMV